MANDYVVMRSNYFRVKDESSFRKMMDRVVASDDSISLWDDVKDEQGRQMFGFGVYGCLCGLPGDDGELDDNSYDRFFEALRGAVADDDAIILMEISHNKLQYVDGYAYILTSQRDEWVSLQNTAVQTAAQMLGDPNWGTKTEY